MGLVVGSLSSDVDDTPGGMAGAPPLTLLIATWSGIHGWFGGMIDWGGGSLG